jgi:hypothetical protein
MLRVGLTHLNNEAFGFLLEKAGIDRNNNNLHKI